jgi:hypothetical protein
LFSAEKVSAARIALAQSLVIFFPENQYENKKGGIGQICLKWNLL